ncbi:hypothetical protein [Streptomyces sp. NPDC005890]|uniref:hypothetical protein n=1 Tax=Streptomyces sp. NPDC005890 TaxID=3154568 RepID=UPI0033CD9B1E
MPAPGALLGGLAFEVKLDGYRALLFPLARRWTAVRLAEELPAYFVAFDVLQAGGEVLLKQPYAARRAWLEQLCIKHALAPPWLLCRATDAGGSHRSG